MNKGIERCETCEGKKEQTDKLSAIIWDIYYLKKRLNYDVVTLNLNRL